MTKCLNCNCIFTSYNEYIGQPDPNCPKCNSTNISSDKNIAPVYYNPKQISVLKKATIVTGDLTDITGLVVAYDFLENKVTLELNDNITTVVLPSEMINQSN